MDANQLDSVFYALSDHTRRKIIQRLTRAEKTVGDLAKPFSMSLPAITKHIKVLEKAGLVSKRRAGKFIYCRLEQKKLVAAQSWIAKQQEYWEAQLDGLAAHLAAKKKKRKNGDV